MADAARSAYRKAVDLLSLRPHFEREIQNKLERRGFEGAEIEEALERLRGIDYLDDDRCARDFVRAKLRRSPVGRRKLMADLRRKGAGRESIEDCRAWDGKSRADRGRSRRRQEGRRADAGRGNRQEPVQTISKQIGIKKFSYSLQIY